MHRNLDLNRLIGEITGRPTSMFLSDLSDNYTRLSERIDGKSALVIGGAGTIGAAFIRALLQFKPAKLVVVDINENGLTELVRDLRSSLGLHIPPVLLTYPVDFGDRVFRRLFEAEGPFDIVANFAAHKHVRSEKDRFSIEAMIENNVLKAKSLLDLLAEYPPKHFFCVSTDKAANPVNVMGATKKLMEDVIQSYADHFPVATARFANVAFSNGSLPFGFLERLMKKQPLSAPSDVKRFFVSPEESGQLCMLACLLGQTGDIFFPKLDPESDLKTFTFIADHLLQKLGYVPDICASEQEAREKALLLNEHSSSYPVYYFHSDTSGEKAFEEFFTQGETIDTSRFRSIGIVRMNSRSTIADLDAVLTRFRDLFEQPELDKLQIVHLLADIVPGFEHLETGKSLDQKM